MKNLSIGWKLLLAGKEMFSVLRRKEFYCPHNFCERDLFQVKAIKYFSKMLSQVNGNAKLMLSFNFFLISLSLF